MSIYYYSENEEKKKEESINNHIQIFIEYFDNPPSLSEALNQ